jgi:hypothetical protein
MTDYDCNICWFCVGYDDGPCKNGFPRRDLESLTNIICQMLN